MRVGTDSATGAIVASITRQPPYGLDWPRDGAFFDVLLDATGQSDLVTRRAGLYGEWQRDEAVLPTPGVDPPPPPEPGATRGRTYPADAWEMNYYPDGMVGGIFRFEIDNTAFVVWTIVAHAGWVGDPQGYLRDHWETVRRGADLLARWRDPETGLHWPAQEDDQAAYTQTLHGAITVFGALEIASRGARLLGEDEDAAAWEDRAAELRDAILTHLYDEREMRLIGGTGQTAWAVWPMPLLPWDDPRIDRQLQLDIEAIAPYVELSNEGGAYFMKNTLALALARGADPVLGPRIAMMRDQLATHATDGGDHFGEVTVVVSDGRTARADQRVATPHLWEGALFFLTAMAAERPEALLRYDEVLPPSRVPEPFARSAVDAGGCGCRASGGRTRRWLALLPLALLVLRARARRARRSPSRAADAGSEPSNGRGVGPLHRARGTEEKEGEALSMRAPEP
ncbi:MAG: hypothetical protein M5U28_42675 [Sandaracinaceae bacterium]|nr:hypothetical protein [Sandaracinaceae bacterium]